ncbi:cytochrome P450 [Dactylonectria estremocensis]|uniref:Cytochrome P450 n=1 Tax=Dactylonectria estremocensis TaxID=1079267 RepID=A0A9P9DWU3_9HYPO|nr:cytochrome P450 [Dactylonectria estremocensis]
MLTDSASALSLPISWTLLSVVCFLLYWGVWIIYARCFHPLAQYPGPFLASISRSWVMIQILRAKSEMTQRELHAKLGPIIRIAPNEVAIADPEAIKVIYAVNSGFTKVIIEFSRYPDSFTCLDERVHASRRKLVNNLYSMSNIVQAEEGIDSCTEMFMARMKEFATTGEIIDVAKWSQMYAFDVVGQLFFSRMFGFMKNKSDYRGYIRSLDLLLPILTTSCVLPSYIRPLFLLAVVMLPGVYKALGSMQDIEEAAESCVSERQHLVQSGDVSEKKDILSSLFNIVRDKGEKVDFGMKEVQVEVYVALFAGSDTTAAAISSILYHLMKNPTAYRKLNAEIEAATKSGQLSEPNVRFNEAMKLPYLVACCKEGMRMHPSVGLTLPRNVPRGGFEIAGEWFAEGTRVGVNAAVIHRDRGIFGQDADLFNPDRWFREEAVNMDRHMFQFGGGSRTCIGKNISLCEIHKLIPQLLRSFDIELTEREWKTHNFWFHKPSNVNVRLRLKKSDN